ncbi:MAG TPA: TerC family protein [Acidimicrobiales bacterium]|nr:TerC family protein [Acidimicrobiales bacterium]
MSFAVALAASSSDSGSFASFDVLPWQWIAFIALVATLLLVDLLVLHRKPHVIPIKEAAIETAVWVAIGLSFGFAILAWHGSQPAGEYWTGYLLELSLSVDNVFVWAVILTFFAVPAQYQFRVLFWGVFGALVLRAGFIFAGVALIEQFTFVLYVFGGILLWSAYKIAKHDEGEVVDLEHSRTMRLVRRFIPSTTEYHGQHLFVRENAKRLATPLFAVLVLVESTDLVFAVDSVPAVLAVAREEFIVFSSNAFAILGLRSMYFMLAGMKDRFRYLNIGLGVILASVGVKMLLSEVVHIPAVISLGIILGTLAIAVFASLAAERREVRNAGEAP